MQKNRKKRENFIRSSKKLTVSVDQVSKIRANSTRKFTPRKFINLSLVRFPSSELKKKSSSPQTASLHLKTLSSLMAARLQNSTSSSCYFTECRNALNELCKHPHPISNVLRHIQKGYEERISSHFSPVLDTSPGLTKKFDGSFLNKIKMRRLSSRRHEILKTRKNESICKSVPKLKINSIGVKSDTVKPSGTTNATPNTKILDYQDEFMSKFAEFSESWRQQILQKGKK